MLADHEIRALTKSHDLIFPFEEHRSGDGIISYGLSSYGYDARLGQHFRVFTNSSSGTIDPKKIVESQFDKVFTPKKLIIPPNSFVLGQTVEKFIIPRNVLAICLGKSTYARCGIIINVTPLEPEWRGRITVEISNTSALPAAIYPLEGIMQVVFLRAEYHLFQDEPHTINVVQAVCKISYADREGKYQDQSEVTLPKVL